MRCSECPLADRACVPTKWGVEGGFAVVGEAPGQTEAKQGVPFIGMSGRLLRSAVEFNEISLDDLTITNSIMCHPPGNNIELPDAVLALQVCRDRLIEELTSVKVRAVLAAGGTALKTLFPEERRGILAVRGKPMWHADLGCYVLPTVHPSYILRNPDSIRDLINDIAMLHRLPSTEIIDSQVIKHLVETPNDVLKMIRDVETLPYGSDEVSIDLETSGLDPFTDHIISVGLAFSATESWIIRGSLIRDSAFARHNIYRWLQSKWIMGQNFNQFDWKMFKCDFNWDLPLKFDTMLAHYTLDERQTGHGLKDLSTQYLLAPEYKIDLSNPTAVDYEILTDYQSKDCVYTYMLRPHLKKEMEDEGVDQVHEMLVAAARALAQVELNGVMIDVPYLLELSIQLDKEMQEILLKLQTFAKNYGYGVPYEECVIRGRKEVFDVLEKISPEFNPNSWMHVDDLLYVQLKLGKTGQGTGKEILENIKHPLVAAIQDYKLKSKLRSTYVEGLLKRRCSSGRIHADFMLIGTVTGRLSSRDPNLQNIPQVAGPLIRNAFVATPGWTLVEADYSQLELRVAGWLSRDEELILVYETGRDIHREVAAEVYNKDPRDVTKEERYQAKYVDFGILYGRQAPSLAHGELQTTVAKAQKFIDGFLARFPTLGRWMEERKATARRTGVSGTPFHRKRRFPFIVDSNRGEVERQSVNSPIQSMASDICLGALTRLNSCLDADVARILLTVHDSILLEVRTEHLEEVIPIVRYEMEENIPLEYRLPFKVDLKIGDRWGSLEEHCSKCDEFHTKCPRDKVNEPIHSS